MTWTDSAWSKNEWFLTNYLVRSRHLCAWLNFTLVSQIYLGELNTVLVCRRVYTVTMISKTVHLKYSSFEVQFFVNRIGFQMRIYMQKSHIESIVWGALDTPLMIWIRHVKEDPWGDGGGAMRSKIKDFYGGEKSFCSHLLIHSQFLSTAYVRGAGCTKTIRKAHCSQVVSV